MGGYDEEANRFLDAAGLVAWIEAERGPEVTRLHLLDGAPPSAPGGAGITPAPPASRPLTGCWCCSTWSWPSCPKLIP